jgi:hypothetical protein
MRQMSLRVAQILDVQRSRRTGLWMPAVALNVALLVLVLASAPYVPQLVAFESHAQIHPQPDSQSQPQLRAALPIAQAKSSPQARQAVHTLVRSVVDENIHRAAGQPEAVSNVARDAQLTAIPAVYSSLPLNLKAFTEFASPKASALSASSKSPLPAAPMAMRSHAAMRVKATPEDLATPETYVVLQTTQMDDSGATVMTVCIWRIRPGHTPERQLESAIQLTI